jgi:hypothetical protein
MKDTIETKHMTGLVDKAISKFNQNELCRYEKLFQHSLFCHYTLLSEIEIKNGLRLGNSI